MACALSNHHFYTHAIHHHRHYIPSHSRRRFYRNTKSPQRNPNLSVRLRAVPKSQDPKPPIRDENDDPDLPNLPSHPSSSSGSFSSVLLRLREAFVIDGVGLEILSIALPAALALAADPIASLVDTAFVGRVGSVELAAVGLSVSVFNLVSKLFNVPLLNVTTSFVAEEQALISEETIDSYQLDKDVDVNGGQHKELLPSVSTSLVLAAGIGFVEAAALFVGSGSLMDILGFPHACSS